MPQIWFIAGNTELTPEYTLFFQNHNVQTKIARGTIWILKTQCVDIPINFELKLMLESLDEAKLQPRYKIDSKPTSDEDVIYGSYKTNYKAVLGCGCTKPGITYEYLSKETDAVCFKKGDKYYSYNDLINNKVIVTEEEITERNKVIWKNFVPIQDKDMGFGLFD